MDNKCFNCENLDNDKNGFYCMVIEPKVVDDKCQSYRLIKEDEDN